MHTKELNFDINLLQNVNVNSYNVKQTANLLKESITSLDDNTKVKQLILAIKCIDLTTLSGDDTHVNVERLCYRSAHTLSGKLSKQIDERITTAAVCVYPSRVEDCVNSFKKLNIDNVNIASVATGFPTGQYSLESRLKEILFALESGANEIDIVINRSLALNGDWVGVYDEVKQMRQLCDTRGAHIKAIISAGELFSLENVYKASIACMLAGVHFIKTSTGKETINATLNIGIVMSRAIWHFYCATGIRVGFKPAGGIKTSEDALQWIALMASQLGDEWLSPDLFRIGASSLLNNIEKDLFRIVFKRNALHYELNL